MAPELFGPYRLQEIIGRGGVGEVYRAFDTLRQRMVALKLLRPELVADASLRERFVRECRLTARLTEAHVIPVHDFGEIDGRLFLDMRLTVGADLAAVLAVQGRLSPERAVDIVGQVASALDAAHVAGLVHRDVKPSNVLIEPGGHCYLADFGIARAFGGVAASLTSTGTLVGTPDYAAPERVLGGPGGSAADVYSLTCLLYRILTGRCPFPGEDPLAVAHAHVYREAPRPSQVVASLDDAMDAVIARGMAKDPAARYPSARALAAAAGVALTSRPAAVRASAPADDASAPAAPRASTDRSGWSWAPVPAPRPWHRQVVASVLLLAALVLVGGGAVTGALLLRAGTGTPVTNEDAQGPAAPVTTPPVALAPAAPSPATTPAVQPPATAAAAPPQVEQDGTVRGGTAAIQGGTERSRSQAGDGNRNRPGRAARAAPTAVPPSTPRPAKPAPARTSTRPPVAPPHPPAGATTSGQDGVRSPRTTPAPALVGPSDETPPTEGASRTAGASEPPEPDTAATDAPGEEVSQPSTGDTQQPALDEDTSQPESGPGE